VKSDLSAFWAFSADEVAGRLKTASQGLSSDEARRRLVFYGRNTLKAEKRLQTLGLLLSQFKSPLSIILVIAAGISFFLHEPVDALIIIGIVLLSGLLGFRQEKRAADAVSKLLSIVRISALALRDGREVEIHVEEIVPGDIVILNAGDVIPGDCLLLEENDLFVDEAALTGESFPTEKNICLPDPTATLAERTNALWMGTHVISGTARAVVVRTGAETEFGKLSERLRLRPAETDFELGVRRFGHLLTRITFILVLIIFGLSIVMERPILDSFLFAVALAIGMIPELLPAIISINLAVGAQRMSQQRVIVKQLTSIENFGSMDVLCSDKTGTLTEGVVRLEAALDARGDQCDKARLYAFLNAAYETGFSNPIDEAIRGSRQFDISEYRKIDEVPYD